MALEGLSGITAIEFDLPRREVRIHHDGPAEPISTSLDSLGLGARLISSATFIDLGCRSRS